MCDLNNRQCLKSISRFDVSILHFPSLGEEDIIGKKDVEIFKGGGVKESQDFKREFLERGLPAKREITFETELFGAKTFLIYVEPVFSKDGEKLGVNYMGMEIADQVKKREKMAKLREEIAVQKAKETELNKTIHITEETMRAKQMLATMSHEIRSPLSGVVSMAEILSTTKLDKDQKQLLSVMLSSGDLVLQLINDILDLSKVESGVMKLEATKFRPREVIKHVLQTAAASLKKMLILEGHVSDDVPVEVIGDVLRIRQILTNLISNAIKFTHQGKVKINLYVVADPHPEGQQEQKMENDGTSVAHGLNYIHQDKQMMMHRDINSANVFLCEINCHILQDFLARKLAPLPGDYPTLNDWENHLTTIFPEVRLKRYLEMRGADGGPWRRLCALPAFWVGILYDDISLQNVLDMTADWTTAEREMLRNKVPVTGLKTPFRDGLLKHVAEEVLTFAKDGLDRRGYKETGFLNEVAEVVRTGLTPAEKLLDLYHGKWGQNVDPVFEELLY